MVRHTIIYRNINTVVCTFYVERLCHYMEIRVSSLEQFLMKACYDK